MTVEDAAVGPSVQVGGEDEELSERLDRELTALNARATGAGKPDEFSIRATDDAAELAGGLTGWVWGTLCGVDALWVREELRHTGWGTRLLRAAEAEAVRRGCTDMLLSSYSFQAPDFYKRLGYRETGRLDGIPGGHQAVYLQKTLDAG
ncbi:GNAT family N-acetyltransferase [Streptomyces sp. NPDC050988]|uniref:GNAT family N-acetyltransferase n=1 Tax=Streptomyces sp. NPDC050988 TaxID=3365637 RepID=UPI003790B1A8